MKILKPMQASGAEWFYLLVRSDNDITNQSLAMGVYKIDVFLWGVGGCGLPIYWALGWHARTSSGDAFVLQ